MDDPIRSYYTATYAEADNAYAQIADEAHVRMDTIGGLRRFVETYQLHRAKALDVGSGRGVMQEVIADYTGLDLSSTAARHYRKPFVAASATAIPFRDATFDVAWSIWALEHVPQPEAALQEIRRVVKPGGLMYLSPAWDVPPWAADGLDVRPYRDLSLTAKLRKAFIPLRRSWQFWALTHIPFRLLRSARTRRRCRLRYRTLSPNYATYWQADSDATTRLDFWDTARWFVSRGDACLTRKAILQRYGVLLIRRGLV